MIVLEKSDEEIKEEALMEYNIFEGIFVWVRFPDKQLKVGTYSGLAKGAATLAFGLIGLAATSGVKQKEEFRELYKLSCLYLGYDHQL